MKEQLTKSTRIDLVDALRGFALLAIVLLHNLEHYNIYYIPTGMPEWLTQLDKWLWDTSFLLMAGKAFSTFSLLFGFSFFIQMHNQMKRGNDFRPRFAWRLLLLMLFAQLHALFYNGDILLLYALCGFSLIAVCRLSDRSVFIIAGILLLQPFEWGRFLYGYFDPAYQSQVGNLFMTWAVKNVPVVQSGTFPQVLYSNLTDGQLYSNLWQIENGRLFQVPALFMFGMLLGRLGYFVKSVRSLRFWKRLLLVSAILFYPFYWMKNTLPLSIPNESSKIGFGIATGSYLNFIMMCFIISVFVLFWFKSGNGLRIQRFLIPYGRMSLTNYIMQSMIGSFIYYGYGLGLWDRTGAAVTLLIGAGIFLFQGH